MIFARPTLALPAPIRMESRTATVLIEWVNA
jgi:hypothetical protein